MGISRHIEAAYFQRLNTSLKEQQRAIPCLLIDLDVVDENIAALKAILNPKATLRVVVKSLPSFKLMQYIMERIGTNRLMVFHQPFLTDLFAQPIHDADILLGKPFPVKTAAYFYNHLPEGRGQKDPFRQVQWLVDTQARIKQYVDLAERVGQKIRLNLEIDVGLHRGGFKDETQLREALDLMLAHQSQVELSGFLGYDPHIVKLPQIIRPQKKSLRQSTRFYEQCKTVLKEGYPSLWRDDLTFNGAGSPTVSLHTAASPLNDIAVGSCFVQPTAFDIPSLQAFKPACFIATPVLKKFKGTTLPGLEKWKVPLELLSKRNQQSFFIYGGFWKAEYCYPSGVRQNALFGPSTNQTMLNAPKSATLEVDDFVFLRPHQSEFVFLQFGEILAVRGNQIQERWELLKNY